MHRWRNSGKGIQILETVLYRNILQRFTTGDHRVIGEKEADNRREEESAHRADRGPLESARRLGAGCGETTYKSFLKNPYKSVSLAPSFSQTCDGATRATSLALQLCKNNSRHNTVKEKCSTGHVLESIR